MLYYWQIFSKKKITYFHTYLVWRWMCAQAWAWSKCDLYCNKNKLHIKSKCVTPKLVYNCQKRVKNKVTPEKNNSWNVKNSLSISDIQFDLFFLKKKKKSFFTSILFQRCLWSEEPLKTAVQWRSSIFVLVIPYPLTTNHSSITTVF